MIDPSDTAALGREEAVAHIDALTADVDEARRPEVLAWTVWGLPPWTSMTDYVCVVHDVLWERHDDALRQDVRSSVLANLAVARALLVDRLYGGALDLLEDVAPDVSRTGLATLERLHRALRARVCLATGRLTEGLALVGGGALEGLERDPPDFRAEGLVARALGALIQGDLGASGRLFHEAAVAGAAHDREDLSAWQVARALAGQAHVSFRANEPEAARDLIRSMLGLSRQLEAHSESAEGVLLEAAYSLACGEIPALEAVGQARAPGWRAPDRQGAVDLVMGLPVDLGGASDANEVAVRLVRAADERSRSFDPAGELLATFVAASIVAAYGTADKATELLAALAAKELPGPASEVAQRAADVAF